MSFTRWLSNRVGLSPRPASRRKTLAARPTFRPRLEAMEERWVLSTLTVLNTHDGGAGSLRAEIAAAKKNDTIVFAPSLDGQSITLTSGELLIDKNLTITGPGAGELTISGNNASRVFEAAKGKQVALSGLTISNGLAKAGDGGGILVDSGAVLTLSNSTLSGNSVSFNNKGVGGRGGAIENSGTTTVSGCTLSGNDGNGGAGAIYNLATLTVNNNSVVSGNFNGGIDNIGTATVSGSTVSNNSGSGIDNFSFATLTVSDSTLSHNSSFGNGGAIQNSGTATISNCTLSDNSAPGNGGGIYSGGILGMLTVSGCTLSGNFATGTVVGGDGGGIMVNSGTATINGCTLCGNSANQGGGISVYVGTLTLNNSSLSGNTASTEGGGIFVDRASGSRYANVTLENSSTITGNTAPVGFGADVYNLGVLGLDVSSMIGVLDGNPAVLI